MSKTKLSVNINKVALIRNSRGSNIPDLITFAKDCEEFGADGITVHPRPDERHVRYDDLPALKDIVTTEFNIEGYPSQKFLEIIKDVKPHQATLVPDPPGVLTSNEGWKIDENSMFLTEIIEDLKSFGIRVSLFAEPHEEACYQAIEVGADRIELYTGHYAHNYKKDKQEAIFNYIKTSKKAFELGLGLNAGHDLNLENLSFFSSEMIGLKEVSIGHALISDALYFGISNVIKMYKRLLQD